ncbi:MAG: FKBP-type peptidyl-prolyl cis-trans isomerase [Salinivirgaceae bacterium]|nr:FKBP-type peptidyl-prolyl cis-trans isomerase [Salinivirgaceae bacterium]MDY0280572.1 FKBP-type peptidyl-prolyl cis-trans isomerase [Salinivirgaceae bacterium]
MQRLYIFKLLPIWALLLTIAQILNSCSTKSSYPHYTLIEGDVYYKLIMFGDSRETPKPSDFVTVDIAYRTMNDSLFFKGKRTMQLTEPEFEGSIDHCFLALAENDSASFIIDAQGLFEKTLNGELPSFLNPKETIKVDIKMSIIRTAEQYRREKEEFMAWIKDFGEYERTVLENYIEQRNINIKPTKSGLYFIPIKSGNGKKVEIGDIVTVNYEGRFLNGKFFDSTIKRQQPFEFVYGTEWQVIKGLEEAIGLMKEGDRSVIILPSGLAWGTKGSMTGIIPPFTSVMYEIELVSVQQRSSRL